MQIQSGGTLSNAIRLAPAYPVIDMLITARTKIIPTIDSMAPIANQEKKPYTIDLEPAVL